MRYAGLIKNDVSAGSGVCVSFFVQGCPIRCPGCHNPESWDFNGGKEFTPEIIQEVLNAIEANGIQRNFCIMGGEPLCQENAFLTTLMIKTVREKYPNIKIYVWTGYTWDEIQKNYNNPKLRQICDLANYLIAGPYIAEERDITLPMRGSRNQEIIDLSEVELEHE